MGIRSGQQAGRWLAILDVLQKSHLGMTVKELAEEFDCHPRTVYRDLEALQANLGAPLVCDKDEDDDSAASPHAGRWSLAGARRSTAIEFTPSELLALTAAGRLLAPLADTPYGAGLKTLQAKVRGRLPATAAAFVEEDADFAARVGARADFRRHAATIELLRRAIREKRTVKMRYTSLHSGGKESTRKLDPYRLWFQDGSLYVVGGCHVHGREARTFAVDRIRDAQALEARFQVPESFRWDDYVKDSFRLFRGETSEVVIDFAPPIAPLIRERVWHESQAIQERKGGGVRLTMRVAGLPEVTQWILSFGAGAKAVAPPALVEMVRSEIEGMAKSYARRKAARG